MGRGVVATAPPPPRPTRRSPGRARVRWRWPTSERLSVPWACALLPPALTPGWTRVLLGEALPPVGPGRLLLSCSRPREFQWSPAVLCPGRGGLVRTPGLLWAAGPGWLHLRWAQLCMRPVRWHGGALQQGRHRPDPPAVLPGARAGVRRVPWPQLLASLWWSSSHGHCRGRAIRVRVSESGCGGEGRAVGVGPSGSGCQGRAIGLWPSGSGGWGWGQALGVTVSRCPQSGSWPPFSVPPWPPVLPSVKPPPAHSARRGDSRMSAHVPRPASVSCLCSARRASTDSPGQTAPACWF